MSPANLSPRERAVVERLVAGLAVKAVAAEFGLSIHTVSTYLLRARRKHGSRSLWRLAAVLLGPSPSFADLMAAEHADLSPGELLLGAHLLAGLSNREIGRRLGISESAAARLVSRLLQRVELKTRAGLFAHAFRQRAAVAAPACNENPSWAHASPGCTARRR